MIIECAISQTVPYKDERGAQQLLVLRPGKHNYPMLRLKDEEGKLRDPLLEDSLRVLRKHKKIRFDDLLPSDQEVLKKAPQGVDRTKFLAEKVLLKPSPKGRKISGKEKNAPRNRAKDAKTSASPKSEGDGKKPGKVSGKG